MSRRTGACLFMAAVVALASSAIVSGLTWFLATRGDSGADAGAGESGFDEIVTALREGDIDSVVSRLDFKALPCGVPVELLQADTHLTLLGQVLPNVVTVPGPECRGEEVEGTTVAVFPVVRCDVQFVRSGEAPALVRRSLAKFELYAGIKLRHPIRHSPYYPLQEGFYGVVGKAVSYTYRDGVAAEGRSALMVSVSFNGAIVNLWPGCGEFASGLIDDRFREALLFGPGP